MKKLINTLLFTLIFYSGIAQWNNHAFLSLPVIPNWTVYFNDAVFTSNDTGYYCISTNGPSPSSQDDAGLYQTTDDCNSWSAIFWNSNVGVSSYSVKYFSPHLYYFWNWQGFFRIQRTVTGSGWQSLPQTSGYYKDFFANDSSNYKILYIDYSNKIILRFFQNNFEVRTDTFLINKPSKIFYPIDTVGVLLSLSFPSTGFNTVIQKYTPASNYNLVYQNQNQKLNDLYFPSVNVGYVAGDSGMVLRSNNLGSNWTTLNTGFTLQLNSIFFINDSCGYAVGDSGLIIATSDYGMSWQQQGCPINTNLNKVLFVNDTIGYILSGQKVLKTINGGITWIKENIFRKNILFLSPNPTSGKCIITIPDEFLNERNLTLNIYDNSSKLIQQKTLTMNEGKIKLSLEEQAKGIYNVTLSNGQKSYNGKIVFE